MADRRRRRLGGWRFEGERYAASAGFVAWLEERLGESAAFPSVNPSAITLRAARDLPELPSLSRDPLDRLTHSRGQGLPDIIRMRSGTVSAAPDGVVRPRGDSEVESLLQACAGAGVRVIPWGGGTSVTRGENPPRDEPAVVLDMEHFSGLEWMDGESRLATFGAGNGPAIEDALERHGLTLGLFPQSWELFSLGMRGACGLLRKGGRLCVIGYTHEDVTLSAARLM